MGGITRRACVAVFSMVALVAAAAPAMATEGPSKIEPGLQARLDREPGPFDIIAMGPAHQDLREERFPDRAAALREMDLRSAPFFADVAAVAVASGGSVGARLRSAPAIALRGSAAMVRAVAALSSVTHVEGDAPDAVRVIDPIESEMGATNTQGRAMLEAEDIWALGFRGEGISISVIDTGIDPRLEAFKNADGSTRIAAWRDFVSNQPNPYDDYGHGTHVAGTAAGSSLYNDPSFGVFQETGVAPNATLMVAKFLDGGGSGSFANAILALEWSYANGADITSNSWGSSSCTAGEAVIRSVRQHTDLGMLSVFAAGNSGAGGAGTIGAPACGESALSVGAVDANYSAAGFSSRGPCTDPDIDTPSRICPDIVAKGVAVRSAIPRSGAANTDPSGYKVWQGTSMATPHAAGAVALAEQMKRFYTGTGWDTPGRAEEAVFKLTSLDLGSAGEDNTYGWGHPKLLNIYAILDSTDEANIVPSLTVSAPTVRQGDTTNLTFRVRNLGGAIASGPFRATLTDPAGGETVIKASTPSLGILDAEVATHSVTVNGSVAPGTYTFRGTFDYTWTDGSGAPHTGNVDLSGTFVVARVFVAMAFDGLAPTAGPLVPQPITFTATNTGNETAASTVIEVTFTDDYQFLPGDNLDPQNLDSRYAKPTPADVRTDSNFGRVTLIYTVGTLAAGQSFTFTATLIPTTPGLYRTVAVAKYKDGAGKGFSQGTVVEQSVAAA